MKGIIRLVYTKVIDAFSVGVWEKGVFEHTHKEFYMQAQQFDQQGKYNTFQEMQKNLSKADNLHYLVSTACMGYIQQLNGRFPEVLNTMGKYCVPFHNFKFEIIQSHRTDHKQHKVALHFYSDSLIWIDSLGGQMIIAQETELEKLKSGQPVDTETIITLPNLGIASFSRWQEE